MQEKKEGRSLVKGLWQGVFLLPIKVYKLTLSPYLPSKCGYHPLLAIYSGSYPGMGRGTGDMDGCQAHRQV